MKDIVEFLGLAIAGLVLLMMAFPEHLLPRLNQRIRKVGSSYWGVYEGSDPEESDSLKVIEIQPSTSKEKVTAGSQMYAAGRGTSFRQ